MQRPLVKVLEGARGVDFDAQEREAWAVLAHACEEALTRLHRLHPERGEMAAMRADFQRAAGLPVAPELVLAG